MMHTQVHTLKRALTKPYLTISKILTNSLLLGRSGPRDFSRIIIVAALGRQNGIASGAKLQCSALRLLGLEVELLDATPALRNPLFRIPHDAGSAYIFHADGRDTASLIRSVLPNAARAYRIGYWAWELPNPPLAWRGFDAIVEEVWTPSTFSKNSLVQLLERPIEIVPHHIPTQPAHQRCVNDPFTVLTMADSRSSLSRKNPLGALHAFRAAFGGSNCAKLILKLSGRDHEIRAWEESIGPSSDYGNVRILRDHLDEAALATLYRTSDILLSLHRAEGFGLPLAEAMAHGLPVVGTGWSGNMDFMNDENSCLLPYRLVPISDASARYRDGLWAEPDVDAAAWILRRLYEDQTYYDRIAAAAHHHASAAWPKFPIPA